MSSHLANLWYNCYFEYNILIGRVKTFLRYIYFVKDLKYGPWQYYINNELKNYTYNLKYQLVYADENLLTFYISFLHSLPFFTKILLFFFFSLEHFLKTRFFLIFFPKFLTIKFIYFICFIFNKSSFLFLRSPPI